MSKVRVLLVLSFILTTLVTLPSAQAQTYGVLYSFTGAPGGASPWDVILDAKGNLYGTTGGGGAYGYGTVFKVAATGKETVLYSFTGTGLDGANPNGGLVRDGQGNLYGTTNNGGDLAYCGGYGCGTVFEVDKKGKETVLYSFTGTGGDGADPSEGLVRDGQGNLYGTTWSGGDGNGAGTVFKVDMAGKETVLYSFTGTGGDGANTEVGLVRDGQGNLYGTTYFGGLGLGNCDGGQCGVVFKLDTTDKETVLYRFTGTAGDGANPDAALVLDGQGNLYGTTYNDGAYGYGTVFKVSKKGKETVLYSFTGVDGGVSSAALVRDAQGNLYGTEGGGAYGYGAVFKLDTTGKETVLHGFTGTGGDGASPFGGLVQDKQGNLYGATVQGGDLACNAPNGCGTVFKITLYPVSFSPASLTFSAQTVGTTSAPKTVTLFNNQSVALNITSIAASGDYSAVPGGTKPCASAVAANSSCSFVVRFSPTKIGTIKGAVTVTNDAPTSPQTVILTGKGK